MLTADKEEAERAFTQANFDFAISLVRPKPGESAAKVIEERKEANKVFDETLALAKKHKFPATEIADMMREKSANLVLLASSHDVKDLAGKKAYREEMQAAIRTYNEAIALVQSDKTIGGKLANAVLTGDLAFAEMSRADAINDDDAVNAAKHFEDALKQWKEYDPKKDSANELQAKAKQDMLDKTLLSLLSQYLRLLNATGNNDRASQIEDQILEIKQRRPDLFRRN